MQKVGSRRRVLPDRGPPIGGWPRGVQEGRCRTLFGLRGRQGRGGALLGSNVGLKGEMSRGSPACTIGGPGRHDSGAPCRWMKGATENGDSRGRCPGDVEYLGGRALWGKEWESGCCAGAPDLGAEMTNPTAANAGVRMARASLTWDRVPTMVPSSKYQRFQCSGVPPAGPAWCANDKPSETFSMACWIPIAKRRGPRKLPCCTPCSLRMVLSAQRRRVGWLSDFWAQWTRCGARVRRLLRIAVRSMVLNALKADNVNA